MKAFRNLPLSTGLLNIPMKLYKAFDNNEFGGGHLYHDKQSDGKRCGSRCQKPTWCPKCKKIVPNDEVVKGYEVAEGKYVTLSPAEVEALPLKTLRSIEVQEFAPAESLDPVYFMDSYYLGPDDGGEKGFAILKAAMEKANVIAIAKMALKGAKEHLVAIRPYLHVFAVHFIPYGDEVRDISDIEIPSGAASERDVKLAMQLIEAMAGDGDLNKYRDEYSGAMENAIATKAKGKKLSTEALPTPSEAVDIAEAIVQTIKIKQGQKKKGK